MSPQELAKLDLDAMQVFAEVAKHKSFAKAAQAFGVKNATIRNKITALEKVLKISLLKQSGKDLTLTELGEAYYKYSQDIISIAHEAHDQVNKSLKTPKGTLRVTATPNMAWLLFDDFFGDFLKRYPDIKLKLDLSNEYKDIIKNNYDVAIRLTQESLKDSSLIARHLIDVEVGLFASQEYLDSHNRINNVDDLEIHDFIQSNRRDFIAYVNGTERRVNFKRRVMINSMAACIRAATKGLGIGLFPIKSATREVADKSLVRVLPECKLSPSTLYLVYSGRMLLPPKMQVFLEFIEEWKKKVQENDKV